MITYKIFVKDDTEITKYELDKLVEETIKKVFLDYKEVYKFVEDPSQMPEGYGVDYKGYLCPTKGYLNCHS